MQLQNCGHRPEVDTKLYCFVTEEHACERLVHELAAANARWLRVEPETC